nr:malonyl coenzyme a acyl carrier protein transacylase (FABD) [Polytomella parva]
MNVNTSVQARRAKVNFPNASIKIAHRPSVKSRAVQDNKFDGVKPNIVAYFPGQGAQSVGMAKELVATVPAAKQLFDKASTILGYDLLKVCVEGPKKELDSTAVSQPAIYVASLAAVEKLRQDSGDAAIDAINIAAGLSLGEYTALAFAGAVSFEDGLRLVKIRGESMQAAANATPSGMVSIVGLDSSKVQKLCEAACAEVNDPDAIKIANFLCPGNYAVSGSIKGCEAVEKLGKKFKARKTIRLAVAGAFHTQFMQPAVDKLKVALAATPFQAPRIPVVSNVDAKAHSDPEVIKEILSRQITSPVLWENTVQALLKGGATKSYELGPGKVVNGIVKRFDKTHDIVNIIA